MLLLTFSYCSAFSEIEFQTNYYYFPCFTRCCLEINTKIRLDKDKSCIGNILSISTQNFQIGIFVILSGEKKRLHFSKVLKQDVKYVVTKILKLVVLIDKT